MTKNEKQVLIDGLRKLAADVADLASTLEGIEATSQKQDVPAEESAPLTAHGVKQLSDVKSPEEFAAIVAEAEVIGNG